MKWDKYYHLPEIEEIRKKITETYSNRLLFIEESHQYFLDGVEMECVSNVIHKWSSTDEEKLLEGCAKKAQTDKGYKYYGMTKEEIRECWHSISSKACSFGSDCHAFGESMFYFMTEQYDKILPECKNKFVDGHPHPTNLHEEAVVKFWDEIPENIIPIVPEIKLFCTQGEQPFAGTTDILFYYVNEEDMSKNGILVFDYKSNVDLYKNFKGQKMLWPFNDLLESGYGHYVLQLSLYSLCIELLGFKVLGRRLIWIKGDGNYEKIKIPSVVEKFKEIFNIKY